MPLRSSADEHSWDDPSRSTVATTPAPLTPAGAGAHHPPPVSPVEGPTVVGEPVVGDDTGETVWTRSRARFNAQRSPWPSPSASRTWMPPTQPCSEWNSSAGAIAAHAQAQPEAAAFDAYFSY